MNIVLLGSGNVATHLGAALVGAGHRVTQVFSPDKSHAAALADGVGAHAIDRVSDLDVDADVYVIAVKDDAIQEVVAQFPTSLKGMVVHTAGSVDMDVLAAHVSRYGVLYPVQTFSKGKDVDFSAIPLAVEASDDGTYARLAALAGSLSGRVFSCRSVQRLSLHVAAVFACNFTNHLYAVASGVLERHDLTFDLIRPLILETAEKVMGHAPRDVQTGPAARNDEGTIRKHELLLADVPDLLVLYTALTDRLRSE